jgi:hypothetical protein
MTDLGKTAREVMVPLLCPKPHVVTERRPSKSRYDGLVPAGATVPKRDEWTYVDGQFAGNNWSI